MPSKQFESTVHSLIQCVVIIKNDKLSIQVWWICCCWTPEGSRPAKHSSTKLSGNREVLFVGGLGPFVEDPLDLPGSETSPFSLAGRVCVVGLGEPGSLGGSEPFLVVPLDMGSKSFEVLRRGVGQCFVVGLLE